MSIFFNAKNALFHLPVIWLSIQPWRFESIFFWLFHGGFFIYYILIIVSFSPASPYPQHSLPSFSLSVEMEKHHFEILLILIIRNIFFTELTCGQASGSQAEALAGRISNCSVHCPFSVSSLSLLNCKVSKTETLRFCLYLWLTECYDFGYSSVISMF